MSRRPSMTDVAKIAGVSQATVSIVLNDEMAWGVYQAAHELGIVIPDDLSVGGFDDASLIAPMLGPGLSTMRLPHYEMGQWAVVRLLGSDTEPVAEQMACPSCNVPPWPTQPGRYRYRTTRQDTCRSP